MIVVKIIFEIIKYICIYYWIYIGGYTLIGALYLWSSIWATEDDTFIKCLKRSWRATREGIPWFKA